MNMNANVVIVSGTCCRRADASSSIFIYQKSTFSFFLSVSFLFLGDIVASSSQILNFILGDDHDA
jgi:hypothetical protein